MRTFSGACIAWVVLLQLSRAGCAGCGHSCPALEEADRLYGESKVEAALAKYESVPGQTDDPDARWKALYRSVECLAALDRHGEAYRKLTAKALPETMPFRARFLYLEMEILKDMMRKTACPEDEDDMEGKGKGEPAIPTEEQTEEELKKIYKEFWKIREGLAKMDLEDERYFLKLDSPALDDHHGAGRFDFDAYPTMLDYLIEEISYPRLHCGSASWLLQVLGSGRSASGRRIKTGPPGEQFIVEEPKVSIDFSSAIEIRMALMEEASRSRGWGSRTAAERWKVERLALAWNGFSFMDEHAAGIKAAAILLGWHEDFGSDRGKAMAVAEAAMILEEIREYEPALALYRKAEEYPAVPETEFIPAHREGLEKALGEKSISFILYSGENSLPGTDLTLATLNIGTAHVRIYDWASRKIDKSATDTFDGSKRSYLEQKLKGLTPVKEWDAKIEDRPTLQTYMSPVDCSSLEPGTYLVLACGSPACDLSKDAFAGLFFAVRTREDAGAEPSRYIVYGEELLK
jgi:hypothetical protein